MVDSKVGRTAPFRLVEELGSASSVSVSLLATAETGA